MPKKPKDSVEELSFEAAQARMRGIVDRLEDPELPLEESIRLFEEGSQLARRCQQLLDEAERRVEVLLGEADGRPLTEPLAELDEG